MSEEKTTPPPAEPSKVNLVESPGEGKAFGEERGLQMLPVNIVPEHVRPSGGGDIPPPTSAPAPSSEGSGGAAPADSGAAD